MAVSTTQGDGPRPARKRRPYRMAEIQRAALALFHERGYAETSMEDIGAAVGIAGPSIYRHFGSKAHILESAMAEAGAAFWSGFEAALGRSDEPAEQLQAAVAVYVASLFADPILTAVTLQYRQRLSPEIRAHALREDKRLVAHWVEVLRAARPDLPVPEARLLVRGALDVVLAMALARTSLSREAAMEAARRAMLATLHA